MFQYLDTSQIITYYFDMMDQKNIYLFIISADN